MKFSIVRRSVLGGAAACMLVSSMFGVASANAERGENASGGSKIIRSNERGQTSAHGIVRSVHIGALNGGQVSAGASIVLGDGNAASLPCINTSYWATVGQPYVNWPCW